MDLRVAVVKDALVFSQLWLRCVADAVVCPIEEGFPPTIDALIMRKEFSVPPDTRLLGVTAAPYETVPLPWLADVLVAPEVPPYRELLMGFDRSRGC